MRRRVLGWIVCTAALAGLGFAPSAAQSPDIVRFSGTYDGTRADSNAVELLLYPGGGARLTTTPAASGTPAATPVYPIVERGTWSVGDGFAIVHLTLAVNVVNKKPMDRHTEDVALSFRLFRCTLRLARDDAQIYGKAGLKLHKRNC